MSLFPRHGHVVLGVNGLADTFSYIALGAINYTIMSGQNDQMFFLLFMTLSGCSLLAIPICAAVSKAPVRVMEATLEMGELDNDGYNQETSQTASIEK